MNFSQIIPFDTSKGGNIPNECLDNVRRGYGISNKYGSAWEAWEHTEQHLDPVPDNLDVPIYYSYTTTIDGVTQNFGHINIHLKNGTVWSDGNIYASIEDYTSKKLPKFVGWGESVNDVKVIKGENMEATINNTDDAAEFIRWGFKREPLPNEVQDLIGRTWHDACVSYRTSEAGVTVAAEVNNYANLQAQLAAASGSAIILKPGNYRVK